MASSRVSAVRKRGPRLKPETVKLLRKIKAHILAEPKRLNMSEFAQHREGSKAPACKTTGCIAGWACLVTVDPEKLANLTPQHSEVWGPIYPTELIGKLAGVRGGNFAAAAKRRLGITQKQASALFFFEDMMHEGYYWPIEYSYRYQNANNDKERAKVTAERIEHFIATGGEE